MQAPQFLLDLLQLLLDLAVPAAFCTLAAAGVSLRHEGGINFHVNGRTGKWILWTIVLLTLPQLLSWVAAQQMLLMAARANPMISILERGDSYQPLVELMGGEMIEMSLDSDQTINPWDLPRGDDRPSNDQISFLKNLTRHMLGENTPPDLDIDLLDSVLLEAIASTYKRCSAKTSNPIPLFGDLAAELAHWQDRDRNQKINAMAQMASTKLRAWVDDGPYARLFDRPTTVQLNNPWLYFNVEKLKDDPRLERAMSLLIAHTATYRASGMTGHPPWRASSHRWIETMARFVRGPITVGEPNWAPLELVLPAWELENFMYMGRAGEIELYKHRFTRRYLNISADGRRFYRYSDGMYVEVSQTSALDYVRNL